MLAADRPAAPAVRLSRHALAALAALGGACADPDGAATDAHAAEAVDGGVAGREADGGARSEHAWRRQVIYLALVDRFRNGDPTNDLLGAPDCLDPDDLRLYHGGDFVGLTTALPYLETVGATALWITPPRRQIGRQGEICGYHGYWIDPAEDGSYPIEPRLGSEAELADLVDALHARGMRFVLDVVVNHTGDSAELPRLRPDWFHDPATCAALGPPLVTCPLDHHPDFAQEVPAVADFLSSLEAAAADRFQIDAVRMDTAKHVDPAYFEHSYLPALRAARPGAFAIAEVFDDSTLDAVVPYLDAGFDSAFHFPLRRALVDGVARAGGLDHVAHAVAHGIDRVGIERALDLVLFVDNHDVRRFASEPGPSVSAVEIGRRMQVALTLIFTLPGIPQLYYGDELGLYGEADPDNRRDLPAWATDPDGRRLPHPHDAPDNPANVFARVQRLAELRRSVPALADGAYRELWRPNGHDRPDVFAFSRGDGPGRRIVLTRVGNQPGAVAIPIPDLADGTVLIEELGFGAPARLAIEGGALRFDLAGPSAAIYRME